jgi:hypothetical protein
MLNVVLIHDPTQLESKIYMSNIKNSKKHINQGSVMVVIV